jgi:hypothetical protein
MEPASEATSAEKGKAVSERWAQLLAPIDGICRIYTALKQNEQNDVPRDVEGVVDIDPAPLTIEVTEMAHNVSMNAPAQINYKYGHQRSR